MSRGKVGRCQKRRFSSGCFLISYTKIIRIISIRFWILKQKKRRVHVWFEAPIFKLTERTTFYSLTSKEKEEEVDTLRYASISLSDPAWVTTDERAMMINTFHGWNGPLTTFISLASFQQGLLLLLLLRFLATFPTLLPCVTRIHKKKKKKNKKKNETWKRVWRKRRRRQRTLTHDAIAAYVWALLCV